MTVLPRLPDLTEDAAAPEARLRVPTPEEITAARAAVAAAQEAQTDARRAAERAIYDAVRPFADARAVAERTLAELLKASAPNLLTEGTAVAWTERAIDNWNGKRPAVSKRGRVEGVKAWGRSFTYRVRGFLKDGSEGAKVYEFRADDTGAVADTHKTIGFGAEAGQS